MKDDKKEMEDFQKIVLEYAIYMLDRVQNESPRIAIQALGVVVGEAFNLAMATALGEIDRPKLGTAEFGMLSAKLSSAAMINCALLKLASEPNTQWDNTTLLVGQLKNQLVQMPMSGKSL